MSRQFLYFVDDFDASYLKKNVGVFVQFFQDAGYTTTIATNARVDLAGQPPKIVISQVPSLRLKGLCLYWPTWRLWQTCRHHTCILWGYAERGHVWLLLLLKYLTGATVILKTDSCLVKLSKQTRTITWRQRLFIQWPIKLANVVLVESPMAADFLIQQWHLSSAKIVTIPNGIYPGEIDQVIPSLPLKQKQIVYVGRLLPVKGADLAIKAFQIIQSRYPDWQLKIIGRAVDSDYVTQLKNLANGNSSVRFFPELSKSELWQVLAHASIFLLTSREEGFSNTIPEAMYLQDGLVLTDRGENRFFKTPVTDTYICEVEVEAIAISLEQAIQQYSGTGSSANRVFSLAHLNWANNLDRLATTLRVQ